MRSHAVVQGTFYIAGHRKQRIGSSSSLSLHWQQLLVIVESPYRWQNVFVCSIVFLRWHQLWRLLWFIKTSFFVCWWDVFLILCEVGVLLNCFLHCQVLLVVITFFTNSLRLNNNCCHRNWNSTFDWHLHRSFLNFRGTIAYQRYWWFICVLVFCLSSHVHCYYSPEPRSCALVSRRSFILSAISSFTISNNEVIGNNVFLRLILNSMDVSFHCLLIDWILDEWYHFHVLMMYDLQHLVDLLVIQRHKAFQAFQLLPYASGHDYWWRTSPIFWSNC